MPGIKDYWYIVGESAKLKRGQVLSAALLGEWLALYRGKDGSLVCVVDRCLHRNARLSRGKVVDGELVCPYHGWRYGAGGRLTAIPSEGQAFQTKPVRCAQSYATFEQDGYIYTCLGDQGSASLPFQVPFFGALGYRHLRLKHKFQASVANCVENFIDIPHTTYVHPNIFRYDAAPQRIEADMELVDGTVHVTYLNETANFGIFSKFLNRQKQVIFHQDHFYTPNITHVEYRFGKRRHFHITSQSIPVAEDETHVYTDLTFDYGLWNLIASPFVWLVAKAIIGQDVRIMGEQSAVIRKYGVSFHSTRADLQHVWIEQIYAALLAGRDPAALPAKKSRVEFWI